MKNFEKRQAVHSGISRKEVSGREPMRGLRYFGYVESCRRREKLTTTPLTETALLPKPVSVGSYLVVPTKSIRFGFTFEVRREDGQIICDEVNARRFWSAKVVDAEARKKLTIAINQKKPSGSDPGSHLQSEIQVSIGHF